MFFSILYPHKTLFKSGEKETRTESTAISLIVLENVRALKINIEISSEKRWRALLLERLNSIPPSSNPMHIRLHNIL